jgi:hypothetical protein
MEIGSTSKGEVGEGREYCISILWTCKSIYLKTFSYSMKKMK